MVVGQVLPCHIPTRPFFLPLEIDFFPRMVKARNLGCKLTQNVLLQDLTLSPQPEHQPENLREVSKAQRRSFALPLNEYQQHAPSRNEGMARAYLSCLHDVRDRLSFWRTLYDGEPTRARIGKKSEMIGMLELTMVALAIRSLIHFHSSGREEFTTIAKGTGWSGDENLDRW